ncbi:uncharacterized protein LOC142504919 [Primulina tabacum]|uniref:uncharacterized protein LOC142504919 n=1 Tax=Primulina tabacum TaxID=48773 RepID=UPI003F596F22
MTSNELNYSPIEKLCLALIFVIQKLKHYFQSHIVRLVSKANPLKYVMSRTVLSDRLARWYLQLQQFEIIYIPQKAVKGQALADFLADHPIPADWELSNDFPDEDVLVIEVVPPWKMYFDGAAHKEGAGAGIVFVTSEGEKSSIVPRNNNKQADVLAKLASTLAMPNDQARVPICKSWVIPPLFEDESDEEMEDDSYIVEVIEIEKEDWRQTFVDYLKYEKLPRDPRHRIDIRRRAARFIYFKGTLYRRSFDRVFLRCLGDEEATQAVEEVHSGICGAHQSGPKLHFRIKRMGYYWPTMVRDCKDYVQRCQACQYHANFIHQPPEPLHPTVASWPFDAWGLDVVGPMTKSSAGHLYILAATDYFSKWAEAVPLKEIMESPFAIVELTNFVRGLVLNKRKSSMYYAAANGLAEAFNKTLCNLLKKITSKSKRDWHEIIGEALWAYRTTYRTPTQATPYALVYGVEAVVPLEQQIPSLRMAVQEGLTEEENVRLRLEELEALDEKRLEAQQRLECYQARLSRAFNKKV